MPEIPKDSRFIRHHDNRADDGDQYRCCGAPIGRSAEFRFFVPDIAANGSCSFLPAAADKNYPYAWDWAYRYPSG